MSGSFIVLDASTSAICQMALLSFMSSSIPFSKVEKPSAFGGRSWRKGEQNRGAIENNRSLRACFHEHLAGCQNGRLPRNVRFSRPSIKTPEQSSLSTIDQRNLARVKLGFTRQNKPTSKTVFSNPLSCEQSVVDGAMPWHSSCPGS